MNTIGIIGAMEVEVNTLKAQMNVESVQTIASMDFYKGTYHNRNVIIVRSGIGKVNAAICTQILVGHFGADAIINTGIAGSLSAAIDIGDIVISSDTLQHDMDATGFGYAPGVIPQMDTSVFLADEHMITTAKEACAKVNPEINTHIGRVVSGDQFISDDKKKDFLIETFQGLCTEMEGAAIAQAAHLNHVPFVILRAISDKADGSAQMDYPEFEAKAAKHCINLVDEMLRTL